MSQNWEIRAEKQQDAVFIASLLEQTFGAGRFTKTAYRLREGRPPVAGLSLVIALEGELAGSVRFWQVMIGDTPALLLGPIAVNSVFRSKGAAARLIEHSCDEAATLGHKLIILVGDLNYYERVGFKSLRGAIKFPGPVNYARVLVRPLVEDADSALSGDVVAPTAPAAKFCGYESVMVK